ncbi:uncharacterized protein LOC106647041 [Copidosoma floridanum]|uniref:uncharacterized protein LOC106647041 n=1 Tax=Copidosoma floridanum TaxID=29053 RepID=UPI0006C93E85|nr:uncharacterized protein LOC106647041 [Copidosoma floridanum]
MEKMSSQLGEKFLTRLAVERNSQKKEFDVIKENDNSSCINFNFKSSKLLSKKCKNGVDSLLEKLENYNKKACSSDNFGVPSIISTEEKDSHSINSMSPEYCKSRSPYCRDDVISPTFSNDDSNETKQRRKRKLGKPLKLAKDGKSDDFSKLTIAQSTLPVNSENIHKSVDSQHDLASQTLMLNSTPLINESLSCQLNKFPRNLKSFFTLNECKNFTAEQCDKLNEFFEENNFQQIKEKADPTQIRRKSECSTRPLRKNERFRRKSCSDIKELLPQSTSKIDVLGTSVTFNEVESQLEEMFAGLIESDKDALKKNAQDARKQLNVTEYELQENMKTKRIVDLSNSDIVSSKLKTNHEYKRKKTRTISNKLRQKKTDTSKKKNKCDSIQGILSGNNSVSNNFFKYKGPIIHVKGLNTSPNCAQIMNVSKDDDEDKNKEKRKNNLSSTNGRGKKSSFQMNLEYQGKTCNAKLFNSTLSVRYDAYTADMTWICVLCKKGPHYIVPGNSSDFFHNSSYSGTYTKTDV